MRLLNGVALFVLFDLASVVGVQGQPPETTAPASGTKPALAAPDHPVAVPSPAAGAPAADRKGPTQAVVVGLDTLEGIAGKSVRSETGEDMGHITDILVGANGEAKAAVIDFGGFLGVGSRKVAVDWKTLNFSDSIRSGSVKVALTRDQIRQSPEYKASEPVVILEASKPTARSSNPPDQTTRH